MTTAEALLSRSLRRNLVVGLATIAILFGGVGGWAATTEISGAVIASGILVVDGNVKKVQHPTGGIVSRLLVKEGETVNAGQAIVRLDDTVIRATLTAVSKNINSLHARQARLEAERDGLAKVDVPMTLTDRLSNDKARSAMTNERRLFDNRRASREGQKSQLREQIQQLREQIGGLDVQQQAKSEEIALISKELEGLKRLLDMGAIKMSQVTALERNSARLRGERGQLIASIATAKARIAETELQLLQVDQTMREEVTAELRDLENNQVRLIEQEITALDQLKHIEIKAPTAGVVHQLNVHTEGGVITSAETLMLIVPQQAKLTIEVRIAPRDIDQVTVGQDAKLLLSAFNRNTTPELMGSVARVSADLETDERSGASFYRAAIIIPEFELTKIADLSLVPGMPVESFIRTGDRTFLSYFTKPLRENASRSFRAD